MTGLKQFLSAGGKRLIPSFISADDSIGSVTNNTAWTTVKTIEGKGIFNGLTLTKYGARSDSVSCQILMNGHVVELVTTAYSSSNQSKRTKSDGNLPLILDGDVVEIQLKSYSTDSTASARADYMLGTWEDFE